MCPQSQANLASLLQIEFPSILLPPDISSGSIVDITVGRNKASEGAIDRSFRALQDKIFSSFGAAEPSTPSLRCRNATQTSVVLEWDPVELATANLISLALYRNDQKAGNIPRPLEMHSTKISGLAVDTEYVFHLVLRTTAGTYASERVSVRTHKMTDLSGVTITTGILPPPMREGLTRAVERIGAKIVDGVRIDTTHFVTTEGRGVQWEKAVEMNIPVVRPEWVDACETNGRILGVTRFYLDALRPGPPGEENPVASAPAQKDLPDLPPTEQNGEGSKGDASPGQAAQKKDEGEGESGDDDSEESEEEQEDKVRSGGQDEQKVRLEEREEQKMALRPGQSSSQQPSAEDDDDDGGEDDGSQEKGEKSPGDASSFQEVKL